MKNVLFGMLLLFVTLSAQAQIKKNKNAKYDIEINGNCDMCKKRIEKAALSVKGVKSATWHIDHQDLHLILDENKCTVDQVQEAVAKVGHDTEKFKATDEDYEKLHTCCLYERKQ